MIINKAIRAELFNKIHFVALNGREKRSFSENLSVENNVFSDVLQRFLVRRVLTFRRNVLPHSSGSNSKSIKEKASNLIYAFSTYPSTLRMDAVYSLEL